ncbi:winged helix-turn-helix transcriptional regulator [Candidatus Woesearchaeota archaeon]|nr:winged helix-turn-helix transcriptional regulator [Candidatus Woesearchaeota archaeon]
MRIIHQRITIMNIRKPAEKSLNQQLQWLGSSLGLFNLRDKNKSCFRIFIELLKSTKKNKPLSSDELAEHLYLSRGTVIHHMHHLIESGLVVHQGSSYLLRVDSLSDLIEELEKDIQRTLLDLIEAARNIDNKLSH